MAAYPAHDFFQNCSLTLVDKFDRLNIWFLRIEIYSPLALIQTFQGGLFQTIFPFFRDEYDFPRNIWHSELMLTTFQREWAIILHLPWCCAEDLVANITGRSYQMQLEFKRFESRAQSYKCTI